MHILTLKRCCHAFRTQLRRSQTESPPRRGSLGLGYARLLTPGIKHLDQVLWEYLFVNYQMQILPLAPALSFTGTYDMDAACELQRDSMKQNAPAFTFGSNGNKGPPEIQPKRTPNAAPEVNPSPQVSILSPTCSLYPACSNLP